MPKPDIERGPYVAHGWLSIAKIMGQPVVDVVGYWDSENEVFEMTDVVLADGKKFPTGGAHDSSFIYEAGLAGGPRWPFNLARIKSDYEPDNEDEDAW